MKWENGRISPISIRAHALLPWSACEAGNGWASVTCPPILSLDISLLLDCFALGCEVCSDMCSGGGVMWEVCICARVCDIHMFSFAYFLWMLCKWIQVLQQAVCGWLLLLSWWFVKWTFCLSIIYPFIYHFCSPTLSCVFPFGHETGRCSWIKIDGKREADGDHG